MDQKPAKLKSKIFSFLPKSATVTFQNPPFSPGRESNKHKASNANRGFSGPIISIIPVEAGRKSKNGSFDSQEPTSPKVSCMGQIKHRKKACKSKCVLPTNKKENQDQKKTKNSKPPKPNKILKPSSSAVGVPREDRKLDAKNWGAKANNNNKPSLSDLNKAPSLDQMKRFASGRDSLANFDWKAHDHRNNDSDDEEEKEEDEVFIAHSAPLMVGGGGRVALEPKKEVNLWKRRTMAPPRPLQINVTTKPK